MARELGIVATLKAAHDCCRGAGVTVAEWEPGEPKCSARVRGGT